MKKNMSSYDKLIRLGLSIVIIILYYKEVVTGTLGIIALLFALFLTITSLIGYFPIYRIVGIKTSNMEDEEEEEEE